LISAPECGFEEFEASALPKERVTERCRGEAYMCSPAPDDPAAREFEFDQVEFNGKALTTPADCAFFGAKNDAERIGQLGGQQGVLGSGIEQRVFEASRGDRTANSN
jgi:hypothetical protein